LVCASGPRHAECKNSVSDRIAAMTTGDADTMPRQDMPTSLTRGPPFKPELPWLRCACLELLTHVFFHEESLRGCVVKAVSPRRQPLPAGQTARRCAFPGSDPGIEKHGYALTDLPAAGSSLMTYSVHIPMLSCSAPPTCEALVASWPS